MDTSSDYSSSSVDEFDHDLNHRNGPMDSHDDFRVPTNRNNSMLPEDESSNDDYTDEDDDGSLTNTGGSYNNQDETDEDADQSDVTDRSRDVVRNRPYDEAVELDDGTDDESIPSNLSPKHNLTNTTNEDGDDDDDEEEDEDDGEDEEDDDDEEEPVNVSEASDEEEEIPPVPEYHAEDYSHLNVSREINQLFSMISSYKPHRIELETKLLPFIPEYIPAVGDLDPFIKVPRPDEKPDDLGLKILDEPKAEQSDPTVIKMILAKSSTHLNAPTVKVPSIQNKDTSFPLQIQKWIDNIERLHKTNPPPTVSFKKPMPDIETLMQPWPPAYEEALSTMEIPSAEIDLSTEEYARVVCALLDIPIHDNPIESLHHLFSLYLAFKQNNHFSRQFGLSQ